MRAICVSPLSAEKAAAQTTIYIPRYREQIAFHGLAYLGALFSVLTPGVDGTRKDSSVRKESRTWRSVFHTCGGTEVDSQVTAV